jgi:hypothetical protein
MQWILIIFPALLSGIIGVGISILYHKKADKKRNKLLLLEKLLGNRNNITGKEFSVALNSIIVLFYDSKPVIKALKAFHENTLNPSTGTDISNQKLLDLFKAMCEDLDIDHKPLTDNFFLQPFNLKNNQN